MSRRVPKPLPRNIFRRALADVCAARLPALRCAAVPPGRYPEVTLLIYYFPPAASAAAWEPFEFALRQTWAVLGALETVIVARQAADVPADFATLPGVTVQAEPRLIPGQIASMNADCLRRLYRRFRTRHVLIVQADGWPVRDELAPFLRYDYVGAPNVLPGWRARVADALGKTVLNGGFSLRSRRLCRAVAACWRWMPRGWNPAEDHVYSRFRPFFRLPSAAVARGFSEDALDGLLPPAPTASPMGFHRDSTYAVLFAPQPPLTVVSVVRDLACWHRCVRDNPHLVGARFVCFDNTVENRPIPERYNAFLDALPPDAGWIFFAHEDLAVREDPRPWLARQNPLFPCGLIGTRTIGSWLILPFGTLTDSNRDGSAFHVNKPPFPTDAIFKNYAENCDCCGFFVHAEAFRAWQLRFDPHCAWDLYAEDLCFQFLQRSGHAIVILPIKAHHFSRGNPFSARFQKTLAYLNGKYANERFAGGTCTLTIGRKPSLRLRLWRGLVHVLMPWRFRHPAAGEGGPKPGAGKTR